MFIPKCVQNNTMGGFAFRCYLPEIVKKRKKTKGGEITEISLELVDQSKELPDPITTDLATQLAAGVPLDVVRAKMFGSGSVAGEIIPELSEQDNSNKEENSQQPNLEQLNSQNPQQTNPNKGE